MFLTVGGYMKCWENRSFLCCPFLYAAEALLAWANCMTAAELTCTSLLHYSHPISWAGWEHLQKWRFVCLHGRLSPSSQPPPKPEKNKLSHEILALSWKVQTDLSFSIRETRGWSMRWKGSRRMLQLLLGLPLSSEARPHLPKSIGLTNLIPTWIYVFEYESLLVALCSNEGWNIKNLHSCSWKGLLHNLPRTVCFNRAWEIGTGCLCTA